MRGATGVQARAVVEPGEPTSPARTLRISVTPSILELVTRTPSPPESISAIVNAADTNPDTLTPTTI
ncbi:hypothetical protein [Nocardia salmonicida]|uniref:hypothetical protein n=1 Tax=Nocardia salmonicida TaxID=53431 RepID=UPI0033F8CFD7